MKSYPLSMARNYVATWGLAEAVRELIQNALDSDSPFTYQFEQQEDGPQALCLQSAQTRLNPQALLLGCTDKTNDPLQIGQFGEGFKLALLVLTRLGHDVVIRNGPLNWTPWFEHSELFGAEMLVVKETEGNPDNNDLIFEIYGLEPGDVEAIIKSCLLMQDNVEVLHGTLRGDILKDRPGELFVGNLFVCKTRMKYGYNVRPQHMRLDRDRQTVSDYDLHEATLNMWYATGEHDHIAQMIDEEILDVQYAQYHLNTKVQEAVYRLFRTRNPSALIAGSQQEADRLAKLTDRSVVRVNRGMYHMISNYSGYKDTAVNTDDHTPYHQMKAFFDKWYENMSSEMGLEFKSLLEDSKSWEN